MCFGRKLRPEELDPPPRPLAQPQLQTKADKAHAICKQPRDSLETNPPNGSPKKPVDSLLRPITPESRPVSKPTSPSTPENTTHGDENANRLEPVAKESSRPPITETVTAPAIMEHPPRDRSEAETEQLKSHAPLAVPPLPRPHPQLKPSSSVRGLDPYSAADSTGEALLDAISGRAIKLGLEGKQTRCLLESDIKLLITLPTVRAIMPGASETLVHYVYQELPKILIISINTQGFDKLVPIMESFQNAEVTDENFLPIPELAEENCFLPHSSADCEHEPIYKVFHDRKWSNRRLHEFYTFQWSVLVPNFSSEAFTSEFEPDRVLPFTRKDPQPKNTGHFSQVYRADLLAKYQDALKVQGNEPNETVPVAIKEIQPSERYQVHEEWQREIDALLEFNTYNHEHINRGVSAFSQNERYYIVLEWADGGDLRQFWAKNSRPVLTGELILQILSQFKGIITALRKIHGVKKPTTLSEKARTFSNILNPGDHHRPRFKHPHPDDQPYASDDLASDVNSVAISFGESSSVGQGRSPKFIDEPTEDADAVMIPTHSELTRNNTLEASLFTFKTTEPNTTENTQLDQGNPGFFIQPPPSDFDSNEYHDDDDQDNDIQSQSHWRIGDIKPDNILRFKDDTFLGKLKLADFGRARKHVLVTSLRKRSTLEKYATRKYEPPEAVTDETKDKPRSRLYDIWSMGCVMFESIFWLLYGYQNLEIFDKIFLESDQNLFSWNTAYFSLVSETPRKAKISNFVEDCLESMMNDDPECQKETAIRDLLKFIKDRLLVVDLPTSKAEKQTGRADAQELLVEITRICDKAQKEEKYRYSGADRSKVDLPKALKNRNSPLPKTQYPNSSNTLAAPQQTHSSAPLLAPQQTSTRSLANFNTYTHGLSNVWHIEEDDDFGHRLLQNPIFRDNMTIFPQQISTLCRRCTGLDFESFNLAMRDTLLELQARLEDCDLCKLLHTAAKSSGRLEIDNADTNFGLADSGLRLNNDDLPILTLCKRPSFKPERRIPAPWIREGIPKLGTAGGLEHIAIIQEWLQDCDINHDCVPDDLTLKRLPTRLLDLTAKPGKVVLIETKPLAETTKKELKYIALSHAWGDKTNKRVCTFRSNYSKHMAEGIAESDLTNLFQDAVKLTKSLKIRYLWIDSLCIIQREPGYEGDFSIEAASMENVYSSAYSVLSATSCKGSDERMLVDGARNAREVVVCKKKTKASLQQLVYICEDWDDFDEDVLNGPLYKRGWVLQERVLARRVIHVTNKQTYFECGHGIRCETGTKLNNKMVEIEGDAHFPRKAVKNPKGGQIYSFQRLYERYSTLAFSTIQDRASGVLGIEQRLTREFSDRHTTQRGEYGIFEKYLERSLLWRRAVDEMSLKSIDFNGYSMKPPSWSWMTYEGGINYLSPEGATVKWASDISWPTDNNDRNLYLTGIVRDVHLPGPGERSLGELIFDQPAVADTCALKCAVFGHEQFVQNKKDARHYVMLVRELPSESGNVFERVGVATILGHYISEEGREIYIR